MQTVSLYCLVESVKYNKYVDVDMWFDLYNFIFHTKYKRGMENNTGKEIDKIIERMPLYELTDKLSHLYNYVLATEFYGWVANERRFIRDKPVEELTEEENNLVRIGELHPTEFYVVVEEAFPSFFKKRG